MRAPWMTFSPMPPRPNTTTQATARLDLRRVDDRPDARGDAAPEVANLVEGRVGADLRQRDMSGSTVKFEKVEQPM